MERRITEGAAVHAGKAVNHWGVSRAVLVKPVTGTPILLTSKDRENAAGREAWNLELVVDCGQLLTQH